MSASAKMDPITYSSIPSLATVPSSNWTRIVGLLLIVGSTEGGVRTHEVTGIRRRIRSRTNLDEIVICHK